MKLQTKLSLVLLSGLLTVYLASSAFQYYRNSSALEGFSRERCAAEEGEHWNGVERLQEATTAPLIDAMGEGEMDKFEKILASQRGVSGLQDLSLYNADGRIAYSSDPARLKQSLPEELKKQLFDSAQAIRRRTPDSLEMYRSVAAKKSCIECHPNWKEGQIGGVMSMRFSTTALKNAEKSWADFEHNLNRTNATTSLVTAGGLVIALGILIGVVIHFQLSRPLRKLAGSLDVEAEQVGQATAQLSAQSQSLAEGASEQAASLEEISASLEQISSMTQRNAASSQSARELTLQTRAAADVGAERTREVDQAMQGIRAASAEMAVAMSGIKSASNDVSKIIKTIDEIAFQTNILALNAAVEAARAGEAGMGFAVVADEVRNLAQRSAKAARETTDLIETSIQRSEAGVRVTEKVTNSIVEVADKLAEIIAHAHKVDDQVGQIALASTEQSAGISEVSTAVGQMDQVTQGNAASAEESAAAAEEFSAQAEVLRESVRELRNLVGESPTGAPLPPPFAEADTAAKVPSAAARKNGHKPVTHPPRLLALSKSGPRNQGRLKNAAFKDS